MTKKIKYILLFSILMILGLCTKSQARIVTSDPTVSSGGTATITINSQEGVASGSIDVTSSDGLTFVSASGGETGVANGTLVAFAGMTNKTSNIATYKFKVPKVSKTTTYKVVFASSEMKDANGKSIASSSATATITVRGESGNSSSGSSSNGNSSNGNSESNTPYFRDVNETVYATDSVNVRSSYSTSSSVIGSLNEGDSLTRIGIATESVNGITWSKVKYNNQTAYVSSDYLTTEKPEESNNKNLKSLTVEQYKLSPEFSKDITEYNLTIGEDVESLNIKATPEDNSAKVTITGNEKLLIGNNTIEIKVEAEDGTVRTYKINVAKGETDELGLSELTVDGYTLTPEFSSSIYEYILNIPDSSVTNINVNAISNIENSIVEIAGNDDLKPGENIVTILIKSEDGTDIKTYQIIVNVNSENEQIISGIENKDLYMYIGLGALAIIILIIIIVVIVKRRNKNDNNFEPYYGGIDSLNQEKIEEKDGLENSEQNNNANLDYENINYENSSKDRKSVIEENFGDRINRD